MNSTKVIYQTPSGKSDIGYIIDGRTYKDEQGTQRVDYGSVVPTQGGTFMYTPQGGVETATSIAAGLSNAYANSGRSLRSQHNARKNAIDIATRKTLEKINNQKKEADKSYALANQRAYQSYLTAENPYGAAEEQRTRIGLSNSGYAESSKMQIANAYQNALNENQRQKQEYINELDNAYREAVYNGDIEKANALAEYQKLVYQHGIAAAEAIANQKNRAYEAGLNSLETMRKWDMAEREYNASRADELFNQAVALAKMGLSNANIAKTLGVSEAALNEMIRRNFR